MRRILLATLFFVALVAIWAVLVKAKFGRRFCCLRRQRVANISLSAARDGTLFSASSVTVAAFARSDTSSASRSGLPLGLSDCVFEVRRRHDRRTRAGLADVAERLLGAAGACSGLDKPKARCCSS